MDNEFDDLVCSGRIKNLPEGVWFNHIGKNLVFNYKGHKSYIVIGANSVTLKYSFSNDEHSEKYFVKISQAMDYYSELVNNIIYWDRDDHYRNIDCGISAHIYPAKTHPKHYTWEVWYLSTIFAADTVPDKNAAKFAAEKVIRKLIKYAG